MNWKHLINIKRKGTAERKERTSEQEQVMCWNETDKQQLKYATKLIVDLKDENQPLQSREHSFYLSQYHWHTMQKRHLYWIQTIFVFTKYGYVISILSLLEPIRLLTSKGILASSFFNYSSSIWRGEYP